MSNIPTIEMKQLDNTMITLDEAEKISGDTRLVIQKKFRENNIQAIAMLKTGKPGRPSRLFKRSDFNEIYGISTAVSSNKSPDVSANQSDNQNSDMAQKNLSSSP